MAGVPAAPLHQSRNCTLMVCVVLSENRRVKLPPAGPPSVVVPKKWIFEKVFWSAARSVKVWPRNAARFGTSPLVSGIRSRISSWSSSGAAPTVPDGGISSAGSEYRVGLPKIPLLARVSERVMPIVVKRFGCGGSPRCWTRMLRNDTASLVPWFWIPMWPGLRPWSDVFAQVFTTWSLSRIVYVPSSKRIS